MYHSMVFELRVFAKVDEVLVLLYPLSQSISAAKLQRNSGNYTE
jgi:hypothetical protein